MKMHTGYRYVPKGPGFEEGKVGQHLPVQQDVDPAQGLAHVPAVVVQLLHSTQELKIITGYKTLAS